MKTLYTTDATATSGRDGAIHSTDGNLDLNLSLPKEMGGPGGTGTNPEQLFAAGYAACFSSALALVARQKSVKHGAFTIAANVSLGQTDDHQYGLAVTLTGTFPDLPTDQAETLMEAAHAVCPYSNATRNNIPVTLTVA